MTAARQAVEEVARRRLGAPAVLGVTTVLHTWNRWTKFHPHAHLIVTHGGLVTSEDGEARWLEPERAQCLLPQPEVGVAHRRRLFKGVDRLWRRDELSLAPDDPLRERAAWERFLAQVPERMEVYAKRTLADAEDGFTYTARYVTRIGVSNARLLALDQATGEVTLVTKKGEQHALHASELLRRLALHRLPRGFHRMRHAGLYAPRRRAQLEQARALLVERQRSADPAAPAPPPAPAEVELIGPGGVPRPKETVAELYRRLLGVDVTRCPKCDTHLHSVPLGARQDPAPLARAWAQASAQRAAAWTAAMAMAMAP